MAGNPWWSEPGWTLDRFAPYWPRWTVGLHAGKTFSRSQSAQPDQAPRHARPEPEHGTEPDPLAAAPVRTPDDRSTLADLAARSGTQPFEAWIAAHHRTIQASIRATSEAGQAHFAAAVRRALKARSGVAGEDSGPSLGPVVGEVADGTTSDHALHREARDEGPVRAEAQDPEASNTDGPCHTISASRGQGHHPDTDSPKRRSDLRE